MVMPFRHVITCSHHSLHKELAIICSLTPCQRCQERLAFVVGKQRAAVKISVEDGNTVRVTAVSS